MSLPLHLYNVYIYASQYVYMYIYIYLQPTFPWFPSFALSSKHHGKGGSGGAKTANSPGLSVQHKEGPEVKKCAAVRHVLQHVRTKQTARLRGQCQKPMKNNGLISKYVVFYQRLYQY